jgi:hypothetical protein
LTKRRLFYLDRSWDGSPESRPTRPASPRPTALLVEAQLAARRDAELAQVVSAALGQRERNMAALIAKGQAAGRLVGAMSPDAAARLALMLSLGSMLVAASTCP